MNGRSPILRARELCATGLIENDQLVLEKTEKKSEYFIVLFCYFPLGLGRSS
jgi:hypothetical protein